MSYKNGAKVKLTNGETKTVSYSFWSESDRMQLYRFTDGSGARESSISHEQLEGLAAIKNDISHRIWLATGTINGRVVK